MYSTSHVTLGSRAPNGNRQHCVTQTIVINLPQVKLNEVKSQRSTIGENLQQTGLTAGCQCRPRGDIPLATYCYLQVTARLDCALPDLQQCRRSSRPKSQQTSSIHIGLNWFCCYCSSQMCNISQQALSKKTQRPIICFSLQCVLLCCVMFFDALN